MYGLTTAENIRLFLEFWPKFQVEFSSAWEITTEVERFIFKDKSFGFSWCHLYELTPKEHFIKTFMEFSEDEDFLNILHKSIQINRVRLH